MAKSKVYKNPYKLQRVVREPDPEQEAWKPRHPRPDLKAGDSARCSRKPLFYTIPDPCTIVSVTASTRYTSEWEVVVKDDKGVDHVLDSVYFKRVA